MKNASTSPGTRGNGMSVNYPTTDFDHLCGCDGHDGPFTPFDSYGIEYPCPDCGGTGVAAEDGDVCPVCHGARVAGA